MSSARARFLPTLGLALVVVGVCVGVFYLQQPAQPSSSQNGRDPRMISDEQKIAAAEQQIFASVPEKQAAYDKAFAELNAAGMVHSISLPTRESIHRREELLKHFDDANTTLEAVFKNAEETLRTELLREGFSEYTSAKAAARFAQRANIPLILKIRSCDRESNVAFLQLLDLLDTRWGTWRSGDEGHLLFKKPADTNAYNAIRQQIATIGATQQAAQAEAQQVAHPTAKPKP
jgi:hypothetical protein